MNMETIGKYTVIKKLGAGGFGAVYLAEHNHKKVAIKVFNPQVDAAAQAVPSGTEDPMAIMRNRFQQETDILHELSSHPNIVNFMFEDELEDGTPYYVMPYVEHSLVDLIGEDVFISQEQNELPLERRPKKIPLLDAVHILEQVASGLSAVHLKGLVHRDISPSNILIDEHQNVLLCDFGIAKLPGSKNSKSGLSMGKDSYMSPEQRSSAKYANASSDIFSVGVVAYRMLAKCLPQGAFAQPKEFAPEIPDELNTLIMDCLSQNEPQRPKNGTALHRRIQAIASALKEGKQAPRNEEGDIDDEKTPVDEDQETPKPNDLIDAKLKPLYEDIKKAWLNDGAIDEYEKENFIASAAVVDLNASKLDKLIQRVYDDHQKSIKPIQNVMALVAQRIKEQVTKTERELQAHSLQALRKSANAIGWDDATFDAMLKVKIAEYEKAKGWKPLKQKQQAQPTNKPAGTSSGEGNTINRIALVLVVLTLVLGGFWMFGTDKDTGPISDPITGPITEPQIDKNTTITPPKVDESAKQKEEAANQKAQEASNRQADQLAKQAAALKKAQEEKQALEKQLAEQRQQAREAQAALDASKPKLYALTIQTEPSNATVKILNIKPPYEDGIELEAGDYHISVSAPGYETTTERLTLSNRDISKRIRLSKEATKSTLLDDLGIKLVTIPAGSFMMGSNDGYDSEKPIHKVSIQSFKMMAHEVTWDNYQPCIDAGVCRESNGGDEGWGKGKRPVINVSWKDAQTYIKWLNKKTGQTFRLPSESEWEYAARAGSTSKYSWGNDIGRNSANCNGCGSQWDNAKTAPVGSFKPNAFGLYDMHGNVWEWTQDCWNGSYANAPTRGEAWTSGDCGSRVLRGSSWYIKPNYLRSANRYWDSTDSAFSYGFRLVQGR